MHKNPVAIVTGANRGIGRAVALGLAEDGYNLVLVARSNDSLKAVLDEINQKDSDNSHSMFAADISEFNKIKEVVKETAAKYGHIDLLINNAGIYFPGTFSLSIEEFEKTLKINLTAQFVFMQEVIPFMKKQNNGYIINIASRAGKYGFAEDGGYVTSKFGLVGLNESVYREFAKYGIRATAICPGWTDTDMAADSGTPLAPDEMIQPADILKTIRWLLNLSSAVRIREVVIECQKSIL